MSEDKKNGKQNKTVKPFDPMTLRGVTVRNRIWQPPMDTYSALAQDGKPTPFHYQHYVSRSMGGFGMIIMEATAVAPEGRISPCDLGLWDDGQMDAWRWIVADAKAAGATMAVQLNHAGRKGSTGCHAIGFDGQSVLEEQGGWRTVCPSANAYGSLARPRAPSVDEIHTIVDQFRDAAWRAIEAACPGMELTSSLPGNMEVNAPGVTKGSGLLALAAHLGLTRAQTMAVGDSGNDRAMIEAAGLGVAMGNATDDIRKIADVTTDDNNHDGVAAAIEKYVL